MEIKKISLRPNISIFDSFKRIPYAIPKALAEFVDNSIDSFEEHKEKLSGEDLKITIAYYFNKKEPNRNLIVITDNAFGMNLEEFSEALKLQSDNKSKKDRIGKHGLGLKYAATWFSNLWTVETTQKNSNQKHIATIDINNFFHKEDAEITIQTTICSKETHYTIIRLANLEKNILSDENFKEINKHFGQTYSKRIFNKEVKILLNQIDNTNPDNYIENTQEVTAKDFDMEYSIYYDKNTNQHYNARIEDTIRTIDGKSYHFEGHIAISEKILNPPGLFLFKQERLIEICYPKEVFGSFNPYRRIFGKIYLSSLWPIAQTKDKVSWQGELKNKFWDKIKVFLNKPQSKFHKKTILKLASDFVNPPKTIKAKNVAKILEKDLLNNSYLFTKKQLDDDDINISKSFSQKIINLDFVNEKNQTEKMKIVLDEKAPSSNLFWVEKIFSPSQVLTIKITVYLKNSFFHQFVKKSLTDSTRSLLIKLFYHFFYSLQFYQPNILQKVLQKLNHSLSEKFHVKDKN